MAIVEMSKLVLYGVLSEKQQILDALFDCKLVELKDINKTSFEGEEQEVLNITNKDCEEKKLIENAINVIEDNLPLDVKVENNFVIKLEDFKKITNKKGKIFKIAQKALDIQSQLQEIQKEEIIAQNKIAQLTPYLDVKEPFSSFKSTLHTTMLLGQISPYAIKDFEEFLKDYNYTVFETCGQDGGVIKVYTHILDSVAVQKKLAELGFIKCNFDSNKNAYEEIKFLKYKFQALSEKEKELQNSFLELKESLKDLKILKDYFSFILEKQDADKNFLLTQYSFMLEAYLPKAEEKTVANALNKLGCSIEFDFEKIKEGEIPPTITKNKPVTSQFEFVTNMYSAPKYTDLDPNFFVGIFFSLFFGFIMADIGYGICLVVFGVLLALKNKKNIGMKKLMNVLAVGGVASILFGVMFGSFFGVSNQQWSLVPKAIIPNPVTNVISLLIACLVAGVVQIMVSFVLKAVWLIKRGRVLEAIFSGFMWDFFFVGLGIFLLEFAGIASGVGTIGIIIAAISVATSVIGLFIINKGFNRVSKSFGALYGIINLFSDILSYARLFGLMLSGVIIASIVNQLASGFLQSTATFALGAIILFVGHAFNLAMGALGAYIHVARLQYIEFFSRFYEGEGELFVPFGQTNFSYVKLI